MTLGEVGTFPKTPVAGSKAVPDGLAFPAYPGIRSGPWLAGLGLDGNGSSCVGERWQLGYEPVEHGRDERLAVHS